MEAENGSEKWKLETGNAKYNLEGWYLYTCIHVLLYAPINDKPHYPYLGLCGGTGEDLQNLISKCPAPRVFGALQ